MLDNRDGKTKGTKFLSVISVVMGAVSAFIFCQIALLCLSFEYRRSAIASLILAVVYVFLGIILAKVFRRKESAVAKILGVVLAVLLVPSTILTAFAMFSICFKPIVYDSYEAFSARDEVYIEQDYVPDYAQDSKYLKQADGHVNAVSFRIDAGDCGKYENEEYDWAFPYDENRGIPIDEYTKQNAFTDVENTKNAIMPLIGDDDINDYEVLDSSEGNEWAHARFVNRKTDRYIIVVTRYGPC